MYSSRSLPLFFYSNFIVSSFHLHLPEQYLFKLVFSALNNIWSKPSNHTSRSQTQPNRVRNASTFVFDYACKALIVPAKLTSPSDPNPRTTLLLQFNSVSKTAAFERTTASTSNVAATINGEKANCSHIFHRICCVLVFLLSEEKANCSANYRGTINGELAANYPSNRSIQSQLFNQRIWVLFI